VATALPDQVEDRSRWRRVSGPVVLAVAVLGASLLLHVRDPHRIGSYGQCPWLWLTGTYCPGCGGLRAVNDLTDGDVVAAASSNLLLVASIPFVVVLWARSTVDRWRGVRRWTSTRQALVPVLGFCAVTAVFWVLRNTPAGAWLAP
jgi:Protein of unknown function (DUF2752)